MKLNKSAQELLDRYLLAVKRELGGKEREDIAAEIESYIYDLLEERHAKTPEIGIEELENILNEMGAPRKVAAQYSPQRYLIGPCLFPVYWLVLKIMIAIVTGALTLAMVIGAITNPTTSIGLSVLEYFGSIFSGALSAAGAITLVFAIIERVAEGKTIEELEEMQEFNASDLPELPEVEKGMNSIGVSFEIALGIVGIVFFTFIKTTGGYLPSFMSFGSDIMIGRLFTNNFIQFIPAILVLGGLEIARNIMLLVQRQHSSLTNWWHISAESAQVILGGLMLSAMPLITLDFFNTFMEIENYAQIESYANTGFAILLGLSILGSVVDIIKRVILEIHNPAN